MKQLQADALLNILDKINKNLEEIKEELEQQNYLYENKNFPEGV